MMIIPIYIMTNKESRHCEHSKAMRGNPEAMAFLEKKYLRPKLYLAFWIASSLRFLAHDDGGLV
jgi:hypothetical protein